MTKKEWMNILGYYKTMFQLDNLPDKEYTNAMYDELKHHDVRCIAYAVKEIIATETSTYNKYPMLSQINAHLPDFRWQKHEINERVEELKKLLSENLRPNHWYYNTRRQRIQALTAYLTGTPKDTITDSEIAKAQDDKLKSEINAFFGNDTKLLGGA